MCEKPQNADELSEQKTTTTESPHEVSEKLVQAKKAKEETETESELRTLKTEIGEKNKSLDEVTGLPLFVISSLAARACMHLEDRVEITTAGGRGLDNLFKPFSFYIAVNCLFAASKATQRFFEGQF